jgi:hypothetical protein
MLAVGSFSWSVLLPKRNYGYEKRQKELNRQRKQEEKRQRRLDRSEAVPDEIKADEPPVGLPPDE